MMRSRAAILCASLMLVCCVCPAAADIVVDQQYPVKGETTGIRVLDNSGVPVSGATVEVTYRPGSSVSRTQSIGSSQAGQMQWVPEEAGIATITAKWTGPNQNEMSAATNVSVRFASPPIGGIIIMIVAGFVLVIGSIIRVAGLLRSPQVP